MDEGSGDALDVADEAVWPLQSDQPCDKRAEGANKEEIYKRFVESKYT
jgi:hypothetical protein